ncbi:hypothetical protein BFP97_03555 [Roseivirga sp. 4D4]|uniref:hypothetical protein n=1 Tax=Roseivirga sp. 4D4 TaxID=1889784 RepID=UPI0008534AC6|nr:hypothetical protein [Roseivirga sp. 4D4]OEK00636.1 hypothetical protein BFP97_03555 [Roseivirga sp. 4D4]
MKRTTHNKTLLTLIIFFSIIFGNASFAQSSSDTTVGEFEILVTETRKSIELECKSGCAWTDLSFTMKNKYKPYGIDERGMVDINDKDIVKEGELQDFFFTVQTTNKGLKFKGIGGTAWIDLTYSDRKGRAFVLTQLGAEKVD